MPLAFLGLEFSVGLTSAIPMKYISSPLDTRCRFLMQRSTLGEFFLALFFLDFLLAVCVCVCVCACVVHVGVYMKNVYNTNAQFYNI